MLSKTGLVPVNVVDHELFEFWTGLREVHEERVADSADEIHVAVRLCAEEHVESPEHRGERRRRELQASRIVQRAVQFARDRAVILEPVRNGPRRQLTLLVRAERVQVVVCERRGEPVELADVHARLAERLPRGDSAEELVVALEAKEVVERDLPAVEVLDVWTVLGECVQVRVALRANGRRHAPVDVRVDWQRELTQSAAVAAAEPLLERLVQPCQRGVGSSQRHLLWTRQDERFHFRAVCRRGVKDWPDASVVERDCREIETLERGAVLERSVPVTRCDAPFDSLCVRVWRRAVWPSRWRWHAQSQVDQRASASCDRRDECLSVTAALVATACKVERRGLELARDRVDNRALASAHAREVRHRDAQRRRSARHEIGHVLLLGICIRVARECKDGLEHCDWERFDATCWCKHRRRLCHRLDRRQEPTMSPKRCR